MLLLHKPSAEEIAAFLARQGNSTYSYAPSGATRDRLLPGRTVDHNRIHLGHGEHTFERAAAALRRWKMFDMPWLTLCWPDAPIEAGVTVAIAVRIVGLWALSACRIVYVIDEDTDARRYGFAYGTLAAHMESGEERFLVEWRRADGTVWYDILACSRPHHPLARLGNQSPVCTSVASHA
jgi:uncharacterized protein (UPF0548 family)